MIQVRYGVFETNSSSVHSMIMCDDETYYDFMQEKILIGGWNSKKSNKWITFDEALQELPDCLSKDEVEELLEEYGVKSLNDIAEDELLNLFNRYNVAYSYNNYGGEYETFEESFETKSGERVYAFGYYGNDY